MNFKNIAVFVLVVTLTLFAAGCPKRVRIGEIKADPGRYEGKKVAVAGTVTDSYGISVPFRDESGGVYKIEDGSGSIWVVTKRTVPGKRRSVGSKGEDRKGFYL